MYVNQLVKTVFDLFINQAYFDNPETSIMYTTITDLISLGIGIYFVWFTLKLPFIGYKLVKKFKNEGVGM